MIDRLLVVGAVSVDRLPDGRRQAGGAVLHGTRAAAASGVRVATVPLVGPEPEAQDALRELATLGPCAPQEAPASAAFAIDERASDRYLVVERLPGRLHLDATWLATQRPGALLLAPVAGEMGVSVVAATRGIQRRAATLQGWLRRLQPGQQVTPRSVRDLGPGMLIELGKFDLLVASREDLTADATDPAGQLVALRRVLGDGPRLVVTDGIAGAWIDMPGIGTRHLPVPIVVPAPSTIGAGDALAALLIAASAAGHDMVAATRAAMARVGALLEARER